MAGIMVPLGFANFINIESFMNPWGAARGITLFTAMGIIIGIFGIWFVVMYKKEHSLKL